jgi:hypothetical protein
MREHRIHLIQSAQYHGRALMNRGRMDAQDSLPESGERHDAQVIVTGFG